MFKRYTSRKNFWSFAWACAACSSPAADTAENQAQKPAEQHTEPQQQASAPMRTMNAELVDPGPAGAPSAKTSPATAGAPAAGSGVTSTAGEGAGGTTAGAGGTAGAGAAGSAAQATLEIRGDIYSYVWGRRRLTLDLAHGARITHFGLDDRNLLTGPDVDMVNFGSTFWPSPQDRWGWPPVPELDSDPYEVDVTADKMRFASKPGTRAKVGVSKQIRADKSEDCVDVTYELVNSDSAAAKWAAWEITRVAAGGLSFFPTGQRKVGTQLPVVDQGGVSWFQHDPAKISGDGQKFSADGAEGWLAHVSGRTLLVKVFSDVMPDAQAPAPEAEIELYAARGYVEIEPQGPYTELKPGESSSWSVRWLITELPAQVPTELGSQALVEFVRSFIAQPRP